MKREKPMYQTTLKERMAYPLFGFGQNIVYLLVANYLSLFYTDYIFISPFTVSAIFLVAKVWDAVNDPLFGIIVDRTNFKSGKFKPWLRISTFAIPVTTVLLFCLTPELAMGWRVALAVISYLLWDIAYTISDVPVFSLVTAMTGDVQERSMLMSRGSVAGLVCGILVIVVLAPRLETVGFLPIVILAAAISLLAMLPLTLTAKERNRKAAETEMKTDEKPGFREIWQYLRSNKYLAIFMGGALIMGTLNISLSLNNYIMIYFFGGLGFLATMTAYGVVPLLIVYLLMPAITARVDRMTLYRISAIFALVMNVIIFLVGPENRVLYGVLAILKTVVAAPQGMLAFTFTMDCVEYGHFKSGQRREGITMSVQAFVNKFTSAVSSSLMLFILGLVGYIGELDVQSAYTMSAMWTMNYWVPIGGIILCLPFLFAYKLKSRDVQIMADVNSGAISREEGEKLFSRKY